MNRDLPDVKAGFLKGIGIRGQIANIRWIIEKASSRKTSTSALLTMPKPLTVWITMNCGKFLERWEYQTTGLVKKQQLEPDMKQQTVSKSGKKYVKAVYRHLAYLTCM